MSTFIQKLLQRAKGLLGERPPRDHTDAIPGDAYDTLMWQSLRQEAPEVEQFIQDLAQEHPHAEDLAADTFMHMFKSDPKLRSPREMRESHLANLAAQRALASMPEMEELRQIACEDSYTSALSMMSVGGKVTQAIAEYHQRIKEAEELAKEAASQRQSAEDQLAAQFPGLRPGFDPDNPGFNIDDIDPAQLQAMLNHLEQAAKAEAAAEAKLDDVAKDVETGVRQAAQGAVDSALEQAREDSALCGGWGVEPAELQRMTFAERQELMRRLRSAELSHYTKLLGRFRKIAHGERARKVVEGRDEVIGATLGDDLSMLVDDELVNLAIPELEDDFLERLLDEDLMIQETEGYEDAGDGSIICCLDDSGSMWDPDRHGIPARAWARALALALLDQAHRSNRDFVVLLFDSRVHRFTFPAGQRDLDRVLEFADAALGGGTNFMGPLQEAADIIARDYNRGKRRADILFITDGIASVSPDFLTNFNRQREEQGFRVWSVAINPNAQSAEHIAPTLAPFSDNVRSISDFIDPSSMSDVFRHIR